MMPILALCACLAPQEALIERENAPEKVTIKGGLGTKRYAPREKEQPFFKKLDASERKTGDILGLTDYTIKGKKEKYVSWFGIVRAIKSDKTSHELLLEHKYFDGLTDLHIMALSFFGSGDFKARINAAELDLDRLVLVRVYGTVIGEADDVPTLKVEYMRVFPWKTFTFLDCYGEDRRNERWKKLCKTRNDDIYDPRPDGDYYIRRLGARRSK